jgi:hypothetical protein
MRSLKADRNVRQVDPQLTLVAVVPVRESLQQSDELWPRRVNAGYFNQLPA